MDAQERQNSGAAAPEAMQMLVEGAADALQVVLAMIDAPEEAGRTAANALVTAIRRQYADYPLRRLAAVNLAHWVLALEQTMAEAIWKGTAHALGQGDGE